MYYTYYVFVDVLTDENKNDGNEKAQDVSPTGLVVGTHALAKPIQFRENSVFTHRL